MRGCRADAGALSNAVLAPSGPAGPHGEESRMKKHLSTWLSVATTFAGLIVLASVATGVVAATTTYSVKFTEVGLPAGTSWAATLNGVTMKSTTATITFTGVTAATSVYWNITTPVAGTPGVQYAPVNYYGWMNIPSQTREAVVFQKQVQLSFVYTPSGAGSIYPYGTGWYAAGSQFPLTSAHYTGYTFKSWKSTVGAVSFGSPTAASTLATANAPGTVTANFASTSYKVTFNEVGLPAGTTWDLTFNGVVHFSTTATLSVGSFTVGAYSWSASSVAVGTTIQYAPQYGSGTLSVPYQTIQALSFVKQFQVSFAVSPSGGGSTTPSSTAFYTNGSAISVSAQSTATTVFSGWSGPTAISFASKGTASTAATINGSGTITAKFVSGTPCSTCTVTLSEIGLPSGTHWGAYVGSTFYGASGGTVSITGVTSSISWSVVNPVSVGVPGVAYSTPTSYGYLSVPYQTKVAIVYSPVYWVTVNTFPTYSGGVGPYSGYYPAGARISVEAAGGDVWNFKSWSSSSPSLSLTSTSAASTTVVVNGAGTLTANFVPPLKTVQFVAYNLPAGTTWGVAFAGSSFYGNTTTITVTGVTPGYNYWSVTTPVSAGTSGVEYAATTSSSSINTAYQTVQAIVFVKEFQVTIQTTGTTGGAVSPSGAGWYPNGTVLSVIALNASASNFSLWSSSAGTVTIANPHTAGTTITITGAATVSAKFV